MSTSAILNKEQNGTYKVLGPVGSILSIDPQLRSLLQYIEDSRATLNEIKEDFHLSRSNPEDSAGLQRVANRLAGFCADTDDWGFDAIYKVAFGLQVLLLNSFDRKHDDRFWEVTGHGLALVGTLLDQCESDYRQRLAVSDMLESFNQISLN